MPITTPEFDFAYKKLNDNQKKAVDTIEGPVLVMAGPGTGKTQVLTTRIANILKETDTDPSTILALTFTEAATREMRERLISLIGKDGYYVKVCTFHSFCADVIAENPERFSKPAGMQNVTDLEKIQIVKDILENNNFILLKPIGDPLFHSSTILNSISILKREGFTVDKFGELVGILAGEFEVEKGSLGKTAMLEKEKLVNKNLDLLSVYKKYQLKLNELGRFDFEDMINWVVELFEKDSDFLQTYQEKFQYILIDEYQDTNSSQNRLIFALSQYWGEQANIFAVGDPNQSIYRFQGASKENVVEFEKRFPSSVKITLDQNYRSTETILESSAKLLGEIALNKNVEYKNTPIKVAKFSSPIFEDEFIVTSIKKKIKQGLKPKDIAVIVKENKDVVDLINLFKQRNIPFRLEGGDNIIDTPLVSRFINLLRVVTKIQGPLDDLDLFIVLNHDYFKINPLSILKIARTAHQNKKSLADTLLDDHPEIDDHLSDVFHTMISWNSKISNHTLTDIFQIIFQESGLLQYILTSPRPIIELNRFASLFEDVKTQSAAFPGLTLFDYVNNLETMEKNNLKIDENILVGNQNAVTLTTAHKSKGLEWQTVYIYRFADTHWGNKTRREMIKLPPGIIRFENVETEEDKNAEERRLFYVAMTRSKQHLYLVGSTKYENSTKMIFPSIFLSDLPKENLKYLKTSNLETASEKVLSNLLSPSTSLTVQKDEENYLSEIIKNFKLSPTSLNSYLECHYKFKLDNLYRIPRAKAASMCFGTAVHFALEHLYQNLNNTGKLEKKEDFLTDFESALRREILSDTDFNTRLEHGRKILSSYYDFYQNEFTPCIYTEKNFGTSLTSQIYLDDIPLSGKTDRIDLTNKETKHVRFVDYKTGKPKSRNEIEGLNKNSDGDYKRQLVFYHLLADLDKSFPYKVIQTEIDFIEPDSKNEFHRERFSITEKEIQDLKTLIIKSMKEIRNLNFDRTKDTLNCTNCPFLSHCWPNGLTETPI